jgi:hypothetical protein
MKKIILLVLILTVLFSSSALAYTTIDGLIAQVKMTLAVGPPRITDAIIQDFVILSIQFVAENGLAFHARTSLTTATGRNSYVFSNTSVVGSPVPIYSQGLFVTGVGKGINTATHRSIWEIEPSAMGQKWLLNPPPFQYYYIWHDKDTSCFSFYDPSTGTGAVIDYSFYYVPIVFPDGDVYLPGQYEDVVIDLALFFCYVRLKNWNSAFLALNKCTESLSIVRETTINKQADVFFGPQEIEQ